MVKISGFNLMIPVSGLRLMTESVQIIGDRNTAVYCTAILNAMKAHR